MLADLVRHHDDIVLSWTVMQLDHDGPNLRLKARMEFRDHSVLYVRQAITEPACFKYAYHWQDRDGNLIFRWDNAPHWTHVATHPHHKHISRTLSPVEDLCGGDLEAVLGEIAKEFDCE